MHTLIENRVQGVSHLGVGCAPVGYNSSSPQGTALIASLLFSEKVH